MSPNWYCMIPILAIAHVIIRCWPGMIIRVAIGHVMRCPCLSYIIKRVARAHVIRRVMIGNV